MLLLRSSPIMDGQAPSAPDRYIRICRTSVDLLIIPGNNFVGICDFNLEGEKPRFTIALVNDDFLDIL